MYGNTYSSGNGVAAISIIVIMIGIAVSIGVFVAWCRIFRKAGLPWERMFVPLYGPYWSYKLANSTGIFWGVLIVSFAGSVLMNLLLNEAWQVLCLFLCLWLILLLILHAMYCVRMSKAFRKGGGFALGLIFLFPIFVMILGFGKAEYRG